MRLDSAPKHQLYLSGLKFGLCWVPVRLLGVLPWLTENGFGFLGLHQIMARGMNLGLILLLKLGVPISALGLAWSLALPFYSYDLFMHLFLLL